MTTAMARLGVRHERAVHLEPGHAEVGTLRLDQETSGTAAEVEKTHRGIARDPAHDAHHEPVVHLRAWVDIQRGRRSDRLGISLQSVTLRQSRIAKHDTATATAIVPNELASVEQREYAA